MPKVLVISDIHANMIALEKVLEDAKNFDYVIFLGDAVDYGPRPAEVIDWLRNNVDIAVMGNHDNAVAYGVDCGCGELTHELSVYTRENITYKLITDEHIKFLRSLKIREKAVLDGRRIYLVHASPANPLHSYVYPWLRDDELERLMKERSWAGSSKGIQYDLILLGHTHIPMKRRMKGGVIICNPGSVGQPRDGDSRAAYGILDLDTLRFKVRRVKYDIDTVLRALKDLKLERKYVEWLALLLKKANAKYAWEVISRRYGKTI